MSIPDSVEKVTVKSGEPLTRPDGTILEGYINFRGPVLAVVPEDDYTFGGTATAALVDGEFSIDLVPQDANDIDPTAWTYEISAYFTNGPGWVQYAILSKNEPEVFLSDILDPELSDPEYNGNGLGFNYLPLTGGTLSGAVDFDTGDVDVDIQEALSVGVSTGLISGGRMTINDSDPSAVNFTEAYGYIVDYTTNRANPTVLGLTVPAQTVALDSAALNRARTWWLADSTGSIIQQGQRPTASQRRTHLTLGVTIQASGSITEIQAVPVTLPQPLNQLIDLMEALGSFVTNGAEISANGSNLMIDVSSGSIFLHGVNYLNNGAYTQNPHTGTINAQTPASFRYAIQATTVLPTPTNTIDPTMWDNNGTITNVGGGSGRSTVQRIWAVPADTTTNQIYIQYGQATYSDLSTAVANYTQENFVANSGLVDEATIIGFIAVTRTATNLSDSTQARLFRAPKFTKG